MAERLAVKKTYKLFIDGVFPRSESGRSYEIDGAWAARASRKDLRDAVRAARAAQPKWAGRTPYNRGQILYRVAEVMEGRAAQFGGEAAEAIDTWVWYAGWADKLGHLGGTVNAVAGPYFTFTVPEPTGVVGIAARDDRPLVALARQVAPAIVSGNAAVVIASETHPASAIDFAEVLATSDLPAGVVNILTGHKAELLPWLAAHMDVDALDLAGAPADIRVSLEQSAAANVKRVTVNEGTETPYAVTALMEMKTVWHPTRV